MEEIKELLEKITQEKSMIQFIISNVRNKNLVEYNKVDIRPVIIKDEYKYQFTYHYDNKVTHNNASQEEMIEEALKLFNTSMKQGQLFTSEADYQILISKKYKVKILGKKPSKQQCSLEHNRKKRYIIPDNEPCEFLIRLGVMSKEGKVFKKSYDKFKQINRFLEMIADVEHKIDKERTINIIDFGCGKAYLTFALYHYFVDTLNYDVNIIGLDLKQDVVEYCNEVAEDLGYDRLKFLVGDIASYLGEGKVDMVITLHACDTATDDAIVKAIDWDVDVLMSVPCCQHELFDQIQNETMIPMTKHGLIKERLSSLITDSIRANILEIHGYAVQILEFISLEHTPKNLMIRAFKTNKVNKKAEEEYENFKEFWHIDPYLENELKKL